MKKRHLKPMCPPCMNFFNWPGSSPLPALPSHLIKKVIWTDRQTDRQTDGRTDGQPDYIIPPAAGSRRHNNKNNYCLRRPPSLTRACTNVQHVTVCNEEKYTVQSVWTRNLWRRLWSQKATCDRVICGLGFVFTLFKSLSLCSSFLSKTNNDFLL